MNHPQTLYIYDDEGVSAESYRQTVRALRTHSSAHYLIRPIDANEVQQGKWMKNAALFVMPGGADLPYAAKLNGLGNEILVHYVRQGGSFLGICAGAYYGASYVEFDKQGKLEVIGSRELQFFKGKAIGPHLAPYAYEHNKGCRVALIKTHAGWNTGVYYHGGGTFESEASESEATANHTSVLAYYHDGLPCIVHVQHAKGHVILSGVHFEYAPETLAHREGFTSIASELARYTPSRTRLTRMLLHRLGVMQRP
jgi:glutamine amidotransferase-like uncharacterized protein